MKRAGMEQKKVTNRVSFLCRNLAAVLVAAAMILLIPAAAQAGADDYYWDEQTVKEWQENSAQSTEKEEQGFDGHTEEVWSYSEKEPAESENPSGESEADGSQAVARGFSFISPGIATVDTEEARSGYNKEPQASENPSGENEAGDSQAVATGFISEVSLIETEPVVRSSGNLNPFNLEGVELHPVLDELPGLDDAPFDDKHDPEGFESNRGFDLFDPGTWVSGQGFNPFRSGQGFDLFDPGSWGSGNNTGDNPDEAGDTFWFGADETVMSGGSTDGQNSDTDDCLPSRSLTEPVTVYVCDDMTITIDDRDFIVIEIGDPIITPCSESPHGCGDDPADGKDSGNDPAVGENSGDDPADGENSGSDPADGEKDDDDDEKSCAIDPTMDGGGNSGQGGLVNGPPADYDPRTGGFYNGGAQPDMPQEHYEGGGLDNANPDDDDPHSRGAQPDMPQDEFGNSSNNGEATCPHTRGAQPDMPQDYHEGGGAITDGPLSFSQGSGPLFTGSLFGKELELNAETVEK